MGHVFRRNCRSYASLKVAHTQTHTHTNTHTHTHTHTHTQSIDSSLYNYRESLLSKGFSVDLGETLDDVISPYNHALQLDFKGLQGDIVVGCDGEDGGLEEELQGVLDQLKVDLHSMTLQLSRLNRVDNGDDDVFGVSSDGNDHGSAFIDDHSFSLDNDHHMNHNNNNNINHTNNNHGNINNVNISLNHVNNNKDFSKNCNKGINSRNKVIFKYQIEEEKEDDDSGKLPSAKVGF